MLKKVLPLSLVLSATLFAADMYDMAPSLRDPSVPAAVMNQQMASRGGYSYQPQFASNCVNCGGYGYQQAPRGYGYGAPQQYGYQQAPRGYGYGAPQQGYSTAQMNSSTGSKVDEIIEAVDRLVGDNQQMKQGIAILSSDNELKSNEIGLLNNELDNLSSDYAVKISQLNALIDRIDVLTDEISARDAALNNALNRIRSTLR